MKIYQIFLFMTLFTLGSSPCFGKPIVLENKTHSDFFINGMSNILGAGKTATYEVGDQVVIVTKPSEEDQNWSQNCRNNCKTLTNTQQQRTCYESCNSTFRREKIDIKDSLPNSNIVITTEGIMLPNEQLFSGIGKKDINAVKAAIQAGANIKSTTAVQIRGVNNEITALMMATIWGFKEIVQLLLDSGAEINSKDKQNKTALDYANEANKKELKTLLTSRGAKHGKELP